MYMYGMYVVKKAIQKIFPTLNSEEVMTFVFFSLFMSTFDFSFRKNSPWEEL